MLLVFLSSLDQTFLMLLCDKFTLYKRILLLFQENFVGKRLFHLDGRKIFDINFFGPESHILYKMVNKDMNMKSTLPCIRSNNHVAKAPQCK